MEHSVNSVPAAGGATGNGTVTLHSDDDGNVAAFCRAAGDVGIRIGIGSREKSRIPFQLQGERRERNWNVAFREGFVDLQG